MADIIKNNGNNVTICSYEDAGHVFRGNGVSNQPGIRIRLGGTEDGNENAAKQSDKDISRFLKEHHNK